MTDRHYEIERTMTKPSAGGGTVTQTTTGEASRTYKNFDDDDEENEGDRNRVSTSRTESKSVQRKRRRTEPTSPRTGIPRKTPRWTGVKEKISECSPNECPSDEISEEIQRFVLNESTNISNFSSSSCVTKISGKNETENLTKDEKNVNSKVKEENSTNMHFFENENNSVIKKEREIEILSKKPPMHPDLPRKRFMNLIAKNRRDDSTRLRKTIEWLEEGARKLRDDLAETRAQLHEERRASRITRREIEVAVREVRASENAKYQRVIAELKTRLSQSPSRSTTEPSSAITKAELLKDENHKREISAAKKRLAEADATIRKLKSNSLYCVTGSESGKRRKVEATSSLELRKLDSEVKALRAANKKLEDKLNMVCTEAEKIRTIELRIQHENHESELNALKKSLRSDTIRMMDEIKNKDREIERLGRLTRENRKSRPNDDDRMRKLKENENGHQIRLAARIEDKIPQVENVIDLEKSDCESQAEVERLRELAIEQQEFIEVLRQAVKEKERKLDQLSNKKRKEEFYKQWLELEPVAEVDDEEEHEEQDSALSSAPSSLSPQPGGYGQWQTNNVTREAYEALLLDIDEIQRKFHEEQRELARAKSQIRDLEKALLQETRGNENSRRASIEKIRKIEEREVCLLAEIAELREQNELLEFRVLELEESPGSRETPDTADSGIVSPEPINIFKQEQKNKQRDRAVATVLPFSSYTHPASPIAIKKPQLSLQESGIFEDEEEEEIEDDDSDEENNDEIELTSCGTQTEAPVGELLQEVQRLQELRLRIQERATKIPNNSIIESNYDCKIKEDESYREKIRKLEARLAERDANHCERIENDLLVKQREEEILDENYRLTEKVYWLENELKRIQNEEKIFVDLKINEKKKCGSIDVETITEAISNSIDAETMTESEKYNSDVESNPEMTFSPKNIDENPGRNDEMNFVASNDVSKISGCKKNYGIALKENSNDGEASKNLGIYVDRFEIEEKMQEEKIEEMTKPEFRFRGRLMNFENKGNTFVDKLKGVDVTWCELEADHAKKLEEIGRKLEEKVELNCRIMKRVEELEILKKSCNCKCNGISLISGDVSSSISSADMKKNGIRDVEIFGIDEVDNSMDVDVEDRELKMEETVKIIEETDGMTQNGGDGFEFHKFVTKQEEILERKSKSLRRRAANEISKINVDTKKTIDESTEIAIEAKEEIDENSSMIIETECGISRIQLLSEEEKSSQLEPNETLRVTINDEREFDKKVRDNERGIIESFHKGNEVWVMKNCNNQSYNHKNQNNVSRKSDTKKYTIFNNRGLRYVIYPEICV